jgi:hypothetical protein
LRERSAEQPFLVESGNDNGNFHRTEFASFSGLFQRAIVAATYERGLRRSQTALPKANFARAFFCKWFLLCA